MLCNRTVKRITYCLIIRQLRFDKYEDVADELETLYFNCLGNHTADLLPSNELERLVLSNYINSKLLSSVQSSLDTVLGNSADVKSPLRRPKQDISSSKPFFVNQDAVSLPDKPLINSTSGTNSFSACVWNAPKERKRGRSTESSSSINVRLPVSPSDHISNELQEISAKLNSEGQYPQPKTNSFSSIPKTDATNIAADKSHVSVDTLHSKTEVSSKLTASQFPVNYTQYEIPDIADEPSINSVSSGSTQSLSPIHRPSLKNPYLNDSNNKRVVAASVINEVSATYHITPDTVRLNTSSPTDLKVGADEPDQESSVLGSEPNRVCSTTEPTVLEVPGKKSIPSTTDVVGETKHDFSDGAPIDSFGPEKPGSPMYEVTKSNKEVTAQKLPSTVSKGGNQQQEPLVMETRVPKANEDDRVKADTNGTSSGELDNTPVESSPQLSKLNVVFDKPRYTRFSDFGKSEDFANCRKPAETSSENIPHQPATKTSSTEEAVQLEKRNEFNSSTKNTTEEGRSNTKPSKSIDSVSTCSSTTSSSSRPNSRASSSSSKTKSSASGHKRVVLYSVKVGDNIVEMCDNKLLHNLTKDDKISILEILRGSCLLTSTFRKKVSKKFPFLEHCPSGDILYALFGNNVSEYVILNSNPSGHLSIKLEPCWRAEDIIKMCFENTTPASLAALKPGIAFSLNVGGHMVVASIYSSLLRLEHDDKIKILIILSEGWKLQATFKRRVRQVVSDVTNWSLGDILFALFGNNISMYVELGTNKKKKLRVKLKPNYKDPDHKFEKIILF